MNTETVAVIGLREKDLEYASRKLIGYGYELVYAGDISRGSNMQRYALACARRCDIVARSTSFARTVWMSDFNRVVLPFHGKSDLVRILKERRDGRGRGDAA